MTDMHGGKDMDCVGAGRGREGLVFWQGRVGYEYDNGLGISICFGKVILMGGLS